MQTDQPGSLKDKFGGFGAAPTDQLWSKIENKLDQKERKKRGAFWWWFSGVAAGLTFLFLVFRFGYELGKNANEQVLTQKQEEKLSNEGLSQDTNMNTQEQQVDDAVLDNSDKLLEDKNENKLNFSDSKNNLPEPNQNNKDTNEPEIKIVEQNVKVPLKKEILTDVNVLSKMNGTPINRIDNNHDVPFEMNLIAVERKPSTGKWEIGFSAGSLASLESHNEKYLADQNLLTAPDNLNQENAIQGLEFASYNSLTETVAKIYRPLFFEFNASRSIGKRWNIASGLGFNYITAISRYSAGSMESVRSKFWSVSVPVIASYDLIKRDKFSFSAGAGLNYEIPFLQTIRASYFSTFEAMTTTRSFCKGYMISAVFKPEFGFRLNENVSLGVSPLLRYYFHQSLQSDVPLLKRDYWLGLNVGLTWKL